MRIDTNSLRATIKEKEQTIEGLKKQVEEAKKETTELKAKMFDKMMEQENGEEKGRLRRFPHPFFGFW